MLQWRTTKIVEMKGIVILVKVSQMYNNGHVQYHEKYASHCLV